MRFLGFMVGVVLCVLAPARAAEVHQAQVEARVPWLPRAVAASDGRNHLAYELHITSFDSSGGPLTLERLSVFAGDTAAPLLTVAGADLAGLLAQPPEDKADDGVAIGPGRRQVLFLWLTLPPGAPPASLRHQLDFRTAAGQVQRAGAVACAVARTPALEIGPPLRGGAWLAVEGPGNPHSHHWGSMVAVDGELTIPQRFAIDWFGLAGTGHSLRGRHDSLSATRDEDWIGYGAEVLAVANGVVRDVRNDVPDGTPLAPQSVPDDLTARTLYGNFVILEIAPGVFAHYAHLRTGSVTVKVGDRVQAGAVIGRLGQTGAAGAPHLHFHLSDRPTFEQSEGLPFVIKGYTRQGKTNVEATFDVDTPVALEGSPRAIRHAMPLDGDVVRFP
ncbi:MULTISPECIES: M23 family metallopeptidase [Nitrospirillum]|uniref:Peptidase M23-like protein n=1 Tax=Nitrospirillum amazonense TaxID=28077 RepID=A0A560GDF9_9PROT|nr:M23 family metallopeptidase [Nitrospirillum amazonense]MEC4591878.1 M23 family metallopeptidase [Nitrospirillum amazonense]TWB31851.1 peptidase M23-like protein [Nitrospirillum amazonense]